MDSLQAGVFPNDSANITTKLKMKKIAAVLSFLMVALPLLLMVGCETDDTPKPPGPKYNTQGWSRPEAWEGSAGYGPLPQSR